MTIDMELFEAQVRYGASEVWMTVAHADSRQLAARIASQAYRQLDAQGRTPIEVRVRMSAQTERP